MTKLDTDIKKKKELDENEEYFRQVDKPDGWKYVGQVEGDKLKKEKKLTDKVKTDAQSKKGSMSYPSKIAQHLQTRMNAMDAGEDWILNAIPTQDKKRIKVYGKSFDTKKGVVAILKTPQGKVFIKAMRLYGHPEIDVRAIDNFAEEVENTIDSEKGLLLDGGLKKTPSGIILPR